MICRFDRQIAHALLDGDIIIQTMLIGWGSSWHEICRGKYEWNEQGEWRNKTFGTRWDDGVTKFNSVQREKLVFKYSRDTTHEGWVQSFLFPHCDIRWVCDREPIASQIKAIPTRARKFTSFIVAKPNFAESAKEIAQIDSSLPELGYSRLVQQEHVSKPWLLPSALYTRETRKIFLGLKRQLPADS